MRTWGSLVIIALALASILGGFLEGRATTPPPTVVLHQRAPASSAPVASRLRGLDRAEGADAAIDDPFSQDDVVVDRPAKRVSSWLPEQLAIVVGLCGESVVVESRFLRLALPIAFDVDPHAPQARAFADLVRDEHDVLFLHVDHPVSSSDLVALRAKMGPFDGIASRSAAGMPKRLAGTDLLFFDERGDADPGPFAAAGVPLVQRDVTVDDRSAPTYISFMMERAAMRSTRDGRTVVFMRPLPNSLGALNQFTHDRATDIVALR